MWEGGRRKSATAQVRAAGGGGGFRCLGVSGAWETCRWRRVLIHPFIHALLIKSVIHSPSNYCGPPLWGRSWVWDRDWDSNKKALSIRMRRSAG